MEIHDEKLADVARYIELHANTRYEDQRPVIENIFYTVNRFKPIDQNSRVLEIGVGNGWLQIYGKQQAYNIRGLEISPQLIEVARRNAEKYGAQVDLELGNIEETDIGNAEYDVIIASSVFEHVEDWEAGVQKIFRALKPGGLFYFDSTNKFSFTSGEYSFPLYGWMPDTWRFRLRRLRQGEDIMKCGIDFHQFTYPRLRRFFEQTGFSMVLDLVDFKDISSIKTPTTGKRIVLSSVKRLKPLKHLLLTFTSATIFVCIK